MIRMILLITTICSFSLNVFCQSNSEKAIILAVEEGKVFLDLNENNVNVGDRFQVISDRGFFVHPVTGQQISREPEVIAYIQIAEVKPNYSVGIVSPQGALASLAPGMEAYLLAKSERGQREFRKSIAVQPLNVSSARGGYMGFYIADLLTEELFSMDKFRVIDRQNLGFQIDEIALKSQGIIDEKEAITLGRIKGVDFFITGTMYEPDVVETSTGIPIKGIVGAAEAFSGKNLGSNLVSDPKISTLRAIVNISLRVVDVNTGEILFIASEMQQASGRSQIELEQGVLGGLQLQGGATSFLNTVTGQATREALKKLSGYIDDYFEGTIKERNFKGNVIDIGKISGSQRKSGKSNARIIYAEYMNEETMEGKQRFLVNIDKGLSDGYRGGYDYYVYEPVFETSKITGNSYKKGVRKIGSLRLDYREPHNAQGLLTLNDRVSDPENFDFRDSYLTGRTKTQISLGFGVLLLMASVSLIVPAFFF